MTVHSDVDVFPDDGEFDVLEEEPFKSQSKLPDGEFIFLAHVGGDKDVFMEFLDISDSLSGWLDSEPSDLGPILDDIGFRSNFEGLQGVVKVHCRYMAWTEHTMDGVEHETEWEEIDHEEMRVVRLPWYSRLKGFFKWR